MRSTPQALTIGRVARAAAVNIETVRYYQGRGLLPEPKPAGGVFRHYPHGTVDRIRFIKRAQELGFSLDQIGQLFALEDGTNRRAIRRVATGQLAAVRAKIADLVRIEGALGHLIHECESSSAAAPCPIIAALNDDTYGAPTQAVRPATTKRRRCP
jgi:Hg(II)-responsive transcriptional regulator